MSRPREAGQANTATYTILPSDREPVFSDVRSAHQDTRCRIDDHGLIPSHRAAAVADRVPPLRQRGANVGRDAALDSELAASMPDARGVSGFLHVHAEVDHVGGGLHV